jgi:iron-sulfur cluster assembly protein
MNTHSVSLAEGEPLLDGLLRQGAQVAHDCGGTLACVTCRVVVREGLEGLGPASEDEIDLLDRAGATEPGARLACQAAGAADVVVEIPGAATPALAKTLPIAVTERAAKFLAAQLAKHPGAVAVRLGVRPAGCSGLRYVVDHAEEIGKADVVFESHGVRMAVDLDSLPFVHGITVDIVEQGLARRLDFQNPNATQTCGCGESFGT